MFLRSCGPRCAKVRMLPVFDLTQVTPCPALPNSPMLNSVAAVLHDIFSLEPYCGKRSCCPVLLTWQGRPGTGIVQREYRHSVDVQIAV